MPKPKNVTYKLIKDKECIECGKLFTPYLSTQKVCSNACAIEQAKKKVWKEERKKMIDKGRNRTDWLNLLQAVFNTYIRKRDKNLGCISCGVEKLSPGDKWDAGHFFPTTFSFLRFNEYNVHKQCSNNCNRYKRGNLHEYRINLIKKIGQERVDWLEANRHKELKLTLLEIKELINVYKKKIKEL